MLADLTPDAAAYDVLTLWDVIEHVEDPLGLLTAAVERLKPGGWLVVETGNYQSAERLRVGNQWWAYHPEHRWYFTPQAMRQLFGRTGLNETKLCEQTLRPGASRAIGTSFVEALAMALRRPAALPAEWRAYRCARRAERAWPLWAHLPIFALAGRKS